MNEADDRSEPDPFSLEAVVLRRLTDHDYVPLHIIMAAAREPGTVVGFSITDFVEIMREIGMPGLQDTLRFLGDFVFSFFPAEAHRTYLTWSAPFLLVPARLGVDVAAAVADIRRSSGRRLELKPGTTFPMRFVAGMADFDGADAEAAVLDAITRLNEDLRRLRPDGFPILPESDEWRPHFPADYYVPR